MSQPNPRDTGVSQVRGGATSIERKFLVSYLILRDPRVPWYCKAVAGFAVGYALSPITIIPNRIPAIGLLDNLLVLGLGVWLVERLAPRDVMLRYRTRALYDTTQWTLERRSGTRAAVAAVVAVEIALALLLTGALMTWLWLA